MLERSFSYYERCRRIRTGRILWNSRTRQVCIYAYVYVIPAITELFRSNQWISARQGLTVIDNWFRLSQTVIESDRDRMMKWSLKLGYLAGEEDDVHTRHVEWKIAKRNVEIDPVSILLSRVHLSQAPL